MTTSRNHIQHNVKYILFIILAICALGLSPAYSQEDGSGKSPDFDYEPSAEQVELELEQLDAWNAKQEYLGYIHENKEEVIADLVSQFGPVAGEGEDQEALTHAFEETLKGATVEQLYEMAIAADQGQVDAALGYEGGNAVPGAVIPYNATGDLIFTPVNPCRFMDTRFDSRTPTLSGTYAYYYYNYVFPSAATSITQGGQAGGCSIPSGTSGIIAASLNMTTVPTGQGHIKVYPGGTSPPATSFLNYNSTVNANLANSGIIRTDTSRRVHIAIWRLGGTGAQTAEVIGDVMGTFSRPTQISTTMYNYITSSNWNFPNNSACTTIQTVSFYHAGKGWVDVEFDSLIFHNNQGWAATYIELNTGCSPAGVNNYGYIPAYTYFGGGADIYYGVSHRATRRFYYGSAGTATYYFLANGYPGGDSSDNHEIESRSIRIRYTPIR